MCCIARTAVPFVALSLAAALAVPSMLGAGEPAPAAVQESAAPAASACS